MVPTWRDWELIEDVDGYILRFRQAFTFSSGNPTVELDTRRPSDTLVRVSGGAWTASTVGLVNETDEIGPDLNALIACAKPFAYQALRESRVGSARARYEALYQQAIVEARRAYGYDHSNDIDPTVPAERAAPAGVAV